MRKWNITGDFLDANLFLGILVVSSAWGANLYLNRLRGNDPPKTLLKEGFCPYQLSMILNARCKIFSDFGIFPALWYTSPLVFRYELLVNLKKSVLLASFCIVVSDSLALFTTANALCHPSSLRTIKASLHFSSARSKEPRKTKIERRFFCPWWVLISHNSPLLNAEVLVET